MATSAPMEVGLPFEVPQVWGESSKATEGKKMSGVKSAREKKGEKEDRAGKVRGEPMDLAAFEYVRAAGSWQQDFEMCSLANPLLWQMPDASHYFPTFQFMVCWHTQESYFSIEGRPGIRKGHEQGAPIGTGQPEPNLNPWASRELCLGQGCKVCHLNTR